MQLDQLGGLGLAALELDAGVQALGVLADDHQVDRHLAEEAPHALVLLAGANAGEQAELLPQMDVDAAEAGADRRGDGGLQGAAWCGGRSPVTASGSGVPVRSMTSTPASCTSQLIFTPVASTHSRAASASSGPVPSPVISVTSWAMRGETC